MVNGQDKKCYLHSSISFVKVFDEWSLPAVINVCNAECPVPAVKFRQMGKCLLTQAGSSQSFLVFTKRQETQVTIVVVSPSKEQIGIYQ
jgi:hypothetical protein